MLLGGFSQTHFKTSSCCSEHLAALFAALLLVLHFMVVAAPLLRTLQAALTAQTEAQKDQATVKATSVLLRQNFRSGLGTTRLPASADYESNPDKAYPVVYMLHGLYGNHRICWKALGFVRHV